MEDEELVIAAFLEKKLAKSSKRKSGTVEKLDEIGDILTAIQQGAKESGSLLHNWNSEESKYVGHICSVYWEGDLAWYSGRLLNYDDNTKRHYIYYDNDNTAEWIDVSEEACLVCTGVYLAKWGANKWPALHYSVSSAALPFIPSMKGHAKSGMISC